MNLQILSDPGSLAALAAFILQASLKATVLVALVLLVQRLAGRYLSAGARYLLWLSVVIALVTPVGFDTVVPASLVPDTAIAAPPAPHTQASRSDFSAFAPPSFSLPAQGVAAESMAMTDPPSSWMQALPYLWLAGVAAVLGAIAVSSYCFARLVKRTAEAPRAVQELLEDCMRQTGCSARVRVRHSAEIQVPMIAGLFRPVLLLPHGLERQISACQLRHVFIHELMHLQRGDIFSNWIVALAQALHWFNPVIWFAFFRLRQDRELACDAATLQHLAPADRAAYGHTLLRLNDALPQTAISPLALGILDSSSHLQQRILMLVQSSRSRSLPSLASPLLFLPLAAMAFTQPAVRAVEAAAAVEAVAAVDSVAAHEPVVAIEPVAAVAEPAPAPAVPKAIASAPAEPVDTAPAAVVTEPTPTLAEPVHDASPAPEAAVVAAAQAVAAQARTFDPVVPDVALLGQLAAGTAALPVAVGAVATPAAEPDPDLASAIQSLTQEIATARTAGVRFIEELEGTANECTARGDGILATLSMPCTRTRRALRRGQVFYFGYQCYLLTAQHESLAARYEASAPAVELERALDESAENLAAFCSKDTYARQYPAFAALFADAESLEYFKPWERDRHLALYNRAAQHPRGPDFYNTSWYEIGMGQGGGIDTATIGGYVPAAPSAPADTAAPAPAPAPAQ